MLSLTDKLDKYKQTSRSLRRIKWTAALELVVNNSQQYTYSIYGTGTRLHKVRQCKCVDAGVTTG
jgi:hypothetical protein